MSSPITNLQKRSFQKMDYVINISNKDLNLDRIDIFTRTKNNLKLRNEMSAFRAEYTRESTS